MNLVSERIGQFLYEGHRIEFTEYGGGDRWVILIHGQLMPRRMHQPLARKIAGAGNHVVTVDLLGHGRSDRSSDPLDYSMTAFAHQVVALMDELGMERAVVGGTSLGANVTLEVADLVPDRVQGMVIEMPVLDNAVEAGIMAFAPLLFVARLFPFAIDGLRWTAGLVPRGIVPFWVGIGLDTLEQRPGPMAAAIHGLFFGRVAPPSRVRRAMDVPALVIGHPRDPIHPAADAAMLADELPAATFVGATSILEWRAHPERLTGRTIEFVQQCFADDSAGRRLQS